MLLMLKFWGLVLVIQCDLTCTCCQKSSKFFSSPDLSGTHLQSPLFGVFCLSEGDIRGFFDYSVSWRQFTAITCILMQYRAEKEKERISQQFCLEDLPAYDRKHVNSLVIRMLKKLFPVTEYTQFMLYVRYTTLNVTALLKKYSNKEFVIFLTCI